MRKLFTCLFVSLLGAGAHAQCPNILNCPQGSPAICDLSDNDPLLWNEQPYTWSHALGTNDLYEGTADFGLKILPCPNGALDISYVLLLDLDNDNLLETAVTSDNLPPSGYIYANNAFNPGYVGGDLVKFDKRSMPDSLLFRFALEITNSFDTVSANLRWKTGNSFLLPRLPEGRHQLMWWVEQAGEVDYCEHSFRIKDCLPPTLTCVPDWNISIGADSTATLFLNEILPGAEDNTTPYSLLKFSIRKEGDGSDFPLDSASAPVTELLYNCAELDTQTVEVWVKDRYNNTQLCLTNLTLNDDDGICNALFPLLCARPFWDTTRLLKPARFKMVWVDTSQNLVSHSFQNKPEGCAEMKFLPPANFFSLIAEHDTLPLNGVSTYDLLLISRHILAIQPFDAPWKWIAADANKSNSVTTFDMVELRKLILGIYPKLPSNASWRFFVRDCHFPPNPFAGGFYCPPEYTFLTMPLKNYPSELFFDAVKTGDVNGTANPDLRSPTTEERGEPTFLQMPDLDLQAGETYEIPLQMAEASALLGFQFGLQFDSKLIEIEKVSLGSLPGLDENSFALPTPETLNVSWFSPTPQVILPEENLLTLRVRALRPARLSDAILMKNEKLAAEAYEADETIRPLQIYFSKNSSASSQTAVFPPQPNPTNAGANIPIRLVQPETVSVEVADFSGKIIFQNEIPLESGGQMLEIPASAFPAAGVYHWRVRANEFYRTGKLVRL